MPSHHHYTAFWKWQVFYLRKQCKKIIWTLVIDAFNFYSLLKTTLSPISEAGHITWRYLVHKYLKFLNLFRFSLKILERFFWGMNLLELEIWVSSVSEFTWKYLKITYIYSRSVLFFGFCHLWGFQTAW